MVTSRHRIRILTGCALAVTTLGAIVGAYAYTRGLFGDPPSAARIIDRFETVSGKHAGFRRNHAKGICVSGHFDSNGQGASISRARVFEAGSVAVIGRLSVAGGNPAQDDGSSRVRSLALRMTPQGGGEWRTAMNSVPVFPVRTPEALFDLLGASRAVQDATQDATKYDKSSEQAFTKTHPEAAAFENWLRDHPPSSGFDNAAYYSVSAFRFIDRDGAARFVRWSVVPDARYAPMQEAQHGDPDFLERGLAAQLQRGPIRWHLIVTLAQAGDPTDDSTRLWPERRRQIDLGTLVIDTEHAQIDGPCRDISFDPLTLPDGIAASNDPLLAARSAAYTESHERRTSEQAGASRGSATR